MELDNQLATAPVQMATQCVKQGMQGAVPMVAGLVLLTSAATIYGLVKGGKAIFCASKKAYQTNQDKKNAPVAGENDVDKINKAMATKYDKDGKVIEAEHKLFCCHVDESKYEDFASCAKNAGIQFACVKDSNGCCHILMDEKFKDLTLEVGHDYVEVYNGKAKVTPEGNAREKGPYADGNAKKPPVVTKLEQKDLDATFAAHSAYLKKNENQEAKVDPKLPAGEKAYIKDKDLSGLSMKDRNLEGVVFSNCDLTGVDMTGCTNTDKALFVGCKTGDIAGLPDNANLEKEPVSDLLKKLGAVDENFEQSPWYLMIVDAFEKLMRPLANKGYVKEVENPDGSKRFDVIPKHKDAAAKHLKSQIEVYKEMYDPKDLAGVESQTKTRAEDFAAMDAGTSKPKGVIQLSDYIQTPSLKETFKATDREVSAKSFDENAPIKGNVNDYPDLKALFQVAVTTVIAREKQAENPKYATISPELVQGDAAKQAAVLINDGFKAANIAASLNNLVGGSVQVDFGTLDKSAVLLEARKITKAFEEGKAKGLDPLSAAQGAFSKKTPTPKSSPETPVADKSSKPPSVFDKFKR